MAATSVKAQAAYAAAVLPSITVYLFYSSSFSDSLVLRQIDKHCPHDKLVIRYSLALNMAMSRFAPSKKIFVSQE